MKDGGLKRLHRKTLHRKAEPEEWKQLTKQGSCWFGQNQGILPEPTKDQEI